MKQKFQEILKKKYKADRTGCIATLKAVAYAAVPQTFRPKSQRLCEEGTQGQCWIQQIKETCPVLLGRLPFPWWPGSVGHVKIASDWEKLMSTQA